MLRKIRLTIEYLGLTWC